MPIDNTPGGPDGPPIDASRITPNTQDGPKGGISDALGNLAAGIAVFLILTILFGLLAWVACFIWTNIPS